MKYKSENQVKKALKVKSLQNLPEDKMIQFAAMMPDMDKEVAIKIIDQFPEFAKFANEAINTMEREYVSTLNSNKESQSHVHQAFQDIREILKGELNQDNLSFEQKKYMMDLIMETGRLEFDKDTENKTWLNAVLKTALVGVAGALTVAVVFVGGKFLIESGKK